MDLKTPEAQKKSCSAKPPGPPGLLNKRVGQNNALEGAKHDPSFKQALGMVPGKAAEGPKRRPAAAMKRPAASEAIAQGDPDFNQKPREELLVWDQREGRKMQAHC